MFVPESIKTIMSSLYVLNANYFKLKVKFNILQSCCQLFNKTLVKPKQIQQLFSCLSMHCDEIKINPNNLFM